MLVGFFNQLLRNPQLILQPFVVTLVKGCISAFFLRVDVRPIVVKGWPFLIRSAGPEIRFVGGHATDGGRGKRQVKTVGFRWIQVDPVQFIPTKFNAVKQHR